jgi:hypothetical protein
LRRRKKRRPNLLLRKLLRLKPPWRKTPHQQPRSRPLLKKLHLHLRKRHRPNLQRRTEQLPNLLQLSPLLQNRLQRLKRQRRRQRKNLRQRSRRQQNPLLHRHQPPLRSRPSARMDRPPRPRQQPHTPEPSRRSLSKAPGYRGLLNVRHNAKLQSHIVSKALHREAAP